MRLCVVLAILLQIIPFSAHASPVLGQVRYEFVNNGASLSLGADLIKNSSKENATGSLKLQLWATAAPYTGGTIKGYLLGGTDTIKGLGPGQYYENLRRVVSYVPPPVAGTYNIVFLLLEYRSGAYVIVSHVNMTNRKALAPLPLFSLTGPWRWQSSYEGGTVEIDVAKISHRRTGNTGTLKLAVWLTKAPYSGGTLSGYEIGEVRKDPLKPGFYYENVKNVARFVPPPAGSYYASLVLSEWSDGQYRVVAHLSSSTATQFNAPPAPKP